MTYANDVFKMIKMSVNVIKTIERARCFASNLLPYRTDKTDMAEEGKYSYRYTYDDESQLIIDDEGFVYCDEDEECSLLFEVW